jgi:tripartite ATP-independent transporter DctM subunit
MSRVGAPVRVPSASTVRERRPIFAVVAERVDGAIRKFTELAAVLVLVVEFVILLIGVGFRYLLGTPLVWTEEVATALFLWLGMLGAAIALRRGEHMQVALLSKALSPAWTRRLDTFNNVALLCFTVAMLQPAYAFVQNDWIMVSPVLGFSDAFRAAAVLVAMILFLPILARRLAELATWPSFVVSLAIVLGVVGGLWLAMPWLDDIGNGSLIVFFVVMLGAAVALGIPIGFAFGMATLSYMAFAGTTPLLTMPGQMSAGLSDTVLLAIPLFVLLGLMMEMAGIARALVEFLITLVGHMRGGLSYVLLGGMYLVSGISGSKAADMAAIAPALFPEMRRQGSAPGELVALLAAAGVMSETIPPSLVLLIVSSVTGVSVASLFTAGLLPATVAAAALVAVVAVRSRHEVPARARPTARQIGRTFFVALPGLALPLLIRAAVLDGVATPTEVATIGITYTVIVGVFVYRRFEWRRLYATLLNTVALSGAIMLIVATATTMAWALTQSGFSNDLVAVITAMPGGNITFIALSMLAFMVFGSVLEGLPAIVLFGSLLFPIAATLGINPVYFAMVTILSMGLGLFAPPVGIGFYIACAIGEAKPEEAAPPLLRYLVALAVAIVIIAAVPWISTVFI